VHLEQRVSKPCSGADLVIGRVGVLGIANPNEHAQIAPPRMGQPVGGYRQAEPERERFSRPHYKSLAARLNTHDMLCECYRRVAL